MNIRAVDLNLLPVLDALLEEAHVSRAASRLNLSQPAASAALDRLRHLLGDPLLERGRGGMRRTAKAEALRAPLKDALAAVAAVLDPPAPSLAALRATVRVTMADAPAATVIGPLYARVAAEAPGLDLVLLPWAGAAAALEALAKGATDLAVSVLPEAEAIHRAELLREEYVVAMRRDHPAAGGEAGPFDLDRWLAHPHLLVSPRGETRGPLDAALLAHGRTRRVGLVVPSFLLVPAALAGSDLLAMVPSRALPPEAAASLRLLPPPIPVEGFPLHLAWHARRHGDPAVRHVGGLIRALLRGD